MQEYELIYIVAPTVEEEGQTVLNERVGTMITNLKGEIAEVKPWGRRRLAYPIKSFREGNYVEMQLKLDPQAVAELERNMRLNESVIRYLLIRKGEH